MKLLSLFIITIFMSSVHARLFLDVSIENKKGIDRELTLGSELHATKEVLSSLPITLRLKSGLEVKLKTTFENELVAGEIGPSDKVSIIGEAKDASGKVMDKLFTNPVRITLGEEKALSQVFKSEKVEIKIKPYVR